MSWQVSRDLNEVIAGRASQAEGTAGAKACGEQSCWFSEQ